MSVILITSSLFVLFLIGYACVTRQPVVTPHGTEWSFINEPRFYLYPMMVIQLLCFGLIFESNSSTYIKVLFLFLFIAEAIHGAYFTIKRSVFYKEVRIEVVTQNPTVNVIESILKPYKKEHQDIAFTSPHKDLRRLAQINNIPVIFFRADNSVLNSKSAITIIALEKKDSALFKNFTSQKIIEAKTVEPFLINIYRK